LRRHVFLSQEKPFSSEAALALFGTTAFWGSGFVALRHHDLKWLWGGATAIMTAMLITNKPSTSSMS
jgi:hypothetical protein